jgi:tetratricopeptide (TPR) repeat protein
VIGLLLLLTSVPGLAQQALPAPLPSGAEAFVLEHLSTIFRYDSDGRGTRIVACTVRVNSEAGVQRWGQLAFQYAPDSETLEVRRFEVLKADGTIVAGTQANIQDAAIQPGAGAGMFMDIRQTILTVPSFRPGDALRLELVYTVHTPVAPGQFWQAHVFTRDVTVRDEQLTIDLPADSPVRPVVGPQAPDEDSGLQGVVRDGRRTYHWSRGNIPVPAEKPVDDGGGSAPVPDVRFSSFESWDAVGRWYAALARPAAVPDATVRAKAEALVAGLATEDERIRALYEFVSSEIRYVSVSFGVGRYEPHPAAVVLANQYGDCKDKHTLLAALLAAIGIQARPALASSTSKPAPDLPTPAAFDHVITAIPRGDRPDDWIWLDTTPGAAPYGLLLPVLRDAPVLVAGWTAGATDASPPGGLLVRTPARLPFPFSTELAITGTLDSLGVLHARVARTLRGDDETVMRAVLRAVPSTQFDELAKVAARQLKLGTTVSATTVSGLESSVDPLVFTFDVRTPGVLDPASDSVKLPVPDFEFAATSAEEWKTRKQLDLGAKTELVHRVVLELPVGFAPRAPVGISLTGGPLQYASTYHVEGRTLTAERRLRVGGGTLPEAQSAEYVAFVRAVRADEAQAIGLERDGSAAAASIPQDATATELYDAGRAAYTAKDYDRSIALWNRVTELAPEHESAYDALGLAYTRLGRRQEAIDAFRRQIAINPFHHQAHRNLAAVLRDEGNRDEARAEYERHIEINPLDGPALSDLGMLLLDMEQYADAAATLEKAAALVKTDAWVQADLARAWANLGDRTKALRAVNAAVELSSTPGIWTSGAWTLAKVGKDLDRASELAARTVERARTVFANLSAADAGDDELDLVHRLAWSWAAQGMVARQRGDLDRASARLARAWEMSAVIEVADVLGQLYEKQGRQADAVETYLSAVAATKAPPSWLTAQLRRLVGEADIEPLVQGAQRLMLSERGARLDGAGSSLEPSTGEYIVVVDPSGRTVDVRFVEGDDRIRALEPKLREARYAVTFEDEGIARLPFRAMVACPPGGPECDSILLPSVPRR